MATESRAPTALDLVVKAETFLESFRASAVHALNESYQSMTDDRVAAVYLYTLETEIYSDMNAAMRLQDRHALCCVPYCVACAVSCCVVLRCIA